MKTKRHLCELDLGSSSCLPVLPETATTLERFSRRARKLLIVSQFHPKTKYFYKSFAAVMFARRKHVNLLSSASTVIHPLSIFCYIWCQLFMIFAMIYFILIPLRFFVQLRNLDSLQVTYIDEVICLMDIFFLSDIVVTFNTGFTDSENTEVIMRRRDITKNYLRHYFLPDLISSLPFDCVTILIDRHGRYKFVCAELLRFFKFVRVPHVFEYMKNSMEFFELNEQTRRLVRLIIIMTLNLHWITCLSYFNPKWSKIWLKVNTTGYDLYSNDETNLPPDQPLNRLFGGEDHFLGHYGYIFVMTLSMFLGSSYNIKKQPEVIEDFFFIAMTITIGTVSMVYILVVIFDTMLSFMNSKTRYHEMMNQVQKFMQSRQLPMPLQERLVEYYDNRFQGHYFREASALNRLTELLRHEIILHTCRRLVDNAVVFANLPHVLLGSILGCLEREMFLPNDLLVKAGLEGDCMYFISSGTVAVYTILGMEICHLEDGNFFGEVALLMKDSKRIATVVALEMTEVYKLSRDNYRRYIQTYGPLYSLIEKTATARMNQTTLIEEAHRKARGQLALTGSVLSTIS